MKIALDTMILLSAFRYALGRRTYVVTVVCKEIEDNINFLSKSDLISIRSEILEAKDLGMEMDRNEWMNLVRIIDSKIGRT